jgi:uncharacterized hydantoinase/oxoprolinase family protein
VSEENQTRTADRQTLTDATIEQIAEKAAEKAIKKLTNHVYQEVGRSVISKFFYIVGACSLGFYLWLKSKGVI